MAARRSWADLPAELVAEIARCLPCLADRVRAARACHTWLEGVQTEERWPLQLPWLLRPYQIVADLSLGTTRAESFFCVLCNRAHLVAVPHDTRGARFFGAYPGGWLFLARGQKDRHGLVNLRTQENLYLPDYITWERDGLAWQSPMTMIIRAATLSAPPVLLGGCVVAAIVTVPLSPRFSDKVVTFWRMGSCVASCTCTFEFDAEDVIFHNGAFHFLSQRGDLLNCRPEFQDEAPLERLQVRVEHRTMLGCEVHYGPRYLVECRGELLMVLRDVQPHQGVTCSFRVFRMTQEQVPDADHARYRWTELHALNGRMLFVGRGCSRSFEAAHFPGSQQGVYFLDDGNFHGALIRFRGTLRYSCGNNGVWSGPPDRVHYWFRDQQTSTYSSPVWFLH